MRSGQARLTPSHGHLQQSMCSINTSSLQIVESVDSLGRYSTDTQYMVMS